MCCSCFPSDVSAEPFVQGTRLKLKANTFPYNRWLEYARDLKVRLVNWDENAAVPGPSCSAKDFGLPELRRMLEPYENGSDNDSGDEVKGRVDVVEWDFGKQGESFIGIEYV